MSDFNKIILMGRLTVKPELRYTPSGAAVTTLRMASSDRFKSQSGEEKERVLFIDVNVWQKQAETCAEYLIKGQRVLIEGRLEMRDWETADKQKRRNYEIRANRVIFLEKPKGVAAAAGDETRPLPSDNDAPAMDDDSDIPF